MATHSSSLAWRISRTEEPGGLQSIGLKRIRHDLSDSHSHTHTHTHTHTRTRAHTFPSIMLKEGGNESKIP